MKVIVSTIKEISKKANIDLFIDEPDMDTKIVITSMGMCYQLNNTTTQKLNDNQLKAILAITDLPSCTIDNIIIKQNVDPLLEYLNNNNFMLHVLNTLIVTKYTTKKNLEITLGIEKYINDLLVKYLIINNLITPYSSYYRITKDNVENAILARRIIMDEIDTQQNC